ncbi:MAG: hypothetical protein H7321_00590, partial [Bacteroidia bacterium]|nr:hypothetical protein [Bacteroidia bacterium]
TAAPQFYFSKPDKIINSGNKISVLSGMDYYYSRAYYQIKNAEYQSNTNTYINTKYIETQNNISVKAMEKLNDSIVVVSGNCIGWFNLNLNTNKLKISSNTITHHYVSTGNNLVFTGDYKNVVIYSFNGVNFIMEGVVK